MSPEAVPEVALTLAFAVVAASTAPLLLLDDKCAIIAASASFRQAFDIAAPDIRGQNLYMVGNGEWDVPRLHSLLDATLAGAAEVAAYEIDFRHPGSGNRRLVLNAHVLDYADNNGTKLLLSIADVTDARLATKAKDALIAEKAVLMQELQHRIANSLQIIASVLMQGARKAGSSPEAQLQLKNAHSRVMSVAALQRQLAESADGDVDIGAYLRQLCNSLAASMIDNATRIELKVTADEGRIPSNASVSIGLVVTELVINSLKHAFVHNQSGHIVVTFRVMPDGWALTVSDDGIGMPQYNRAVAGLGTNIITALAHHLDAEIEVSDAKPGTRVTLAHVAKDEDEDTFDLVDDEVAI